jgi:protein-disulfide isomerase
MKRISLLAGVIIALSLSSCGSKSESDGDAPSVASMANLPAPAGKKWSEVVAATPEGGYVMGNKDAPIRIIEFGSFSCSHCRDFSAESSQERNALVETGKMSFEYRTFVRDPIDMTMALLAHCGGAEPFFPLSEQLFANQNDVFAKAQAMGEAPYAAAINKPLNERFVVLAQSTGLIDFAKQRGISETKAKQCLTNAKTIDTLVKRVQADTATYNIQGTPTLVMNGKVVENASTWTIMRAKLKEVGL